MCRTDRIELYGLKGRIRRSWWRSHGLAVICLLISLVLHLGIFTFSYLFSRKPGGPWFRVIFVPSRYRPAEEFVLRERVGLPGGLREGPVVGPVLVAIPGQVSALDSLILKGWDLLPRLSARVVRPLPPEAGGKPSELKTEGREPVHPSRISGPIWTKELPTVFESGYFLMEPRFGHVSIIGIDRRFPQNVQGYWYPWGSPLVFVVHKDPDNMKRPFSTTLSATQR